jgi:uncharacterized delta-60 repeat protein
MKKLAVLIALAAACGGTDSSSKGQPQMTIHSLTPNGHDRLYSVVYGPDGKIYAVGQYTDTADLAGDFKTVVVRMNADGALDTTFGTGGFVVRNAAPGAAGELFRGIGVQSNGKVVVSGPAEHIAPAGQPAADPRDRDVYVMRFNTDGTPDNTFGTAGMLTLNLSDGQNRDAAVAPLPATYASDSNFSLAIDSTDRIVLECTMVRPGTSGATADTDAAIVRLSKDGAFDDTFGTNGVARVEVKLNGNANDASPRNVSILADGSIIGAGYQPVPGKDTSPVVFKLTSSGVLDTTFGDQGVFHQTIFDEQTECYKAVVQPTADGTDYKLVTTGYGRDTAAQTTDIVSLRLTRNGQLDTTYGTNGAVRIDVGGFADNSRNLVVLPDRRILLVGGGRPADAANLDGFIGMLLPDGQPDTSFGGGKGWMTIDLGGPADFLWGVALAPDAETAAIVGFKGVGNVPSTSTINDDAAIVLLPL